MKVRRYTGTRRVGRAIGLLDGITRQLDPDLDALEIVGRHVPPAPDGPTS